MEIKLTQKNKSKYHLSVTFSKAEMEGMYENAYSAMSPSVTLPGFRPGKAPRAMTIEAIGAQRLANAAIEEAVRTSYIKAIKDNHLNPLGSPDIKIIKQPSFIEGAENTLEYEGELEVLPEIKFIKDYKKITLSPTSQKEIDLTEKDLDEAMKIVAERRSTTKSVDRGAQNGDKVEITFQGYSGHVAIEQLASKNHPIILGKGTLIPGFEEKLIGAKKGEKKKFDITFPKDYHAKDFAGKKYNFEVTIDGVEEIILPEINDKLAKEVGAKSVADLRNLIKQNLEQDRKNRTRQKQEDEVVEKIVKMTKTDVPEILVASEKARLKKIFEDMAQRQKITLDEYLKNTQTTPEKFESDMEKQARKNVLIGLALRKIAEDEKIELNKDDSLTKVINWLIEKNVKG